MDIGMENDNDMNIDGEASEISPSVWLGSYSVLSQQPFLDAKNIKVIINCSPTCKFLKELSASGMSMSSDLVILLLDPPFDSGKVTDDEMPLLNDYMSRFNRILQNYISFFYNLNPEVNNLIHKFPQNKPLNISSPILTGNLKEQFFNINRLLKLLKNMNNSIGTLIVSPDGNSQLSTGVAMSYLMDNYNFNFDASYTNLKITRPLIIPLNYQYYDDLLIIENLKKFYQENTSIKQTNNVLLTTNCNLKRKNDYDYIWVGGSKRKNVE
ncbi:unnamed protein product [Debaryomyces fabryi]|nr:unnamed protein product [Debaryomyces fabryi]